MNTVLSLSGWWAYAVVGLLSFGEAAAFVGLVLPGGTALLLGGVLAATGHINLPLLLAVAVVAAVLDDSVGYEVGRHGGGPLRRRRLGRRIGEQRWARSPSPCWSAAPRRSSSPRSPKASWKAASSAAPTARCSTG